MLIVNDPPVFQFSLRTGCKFVHASGFIGGNATQEGALAMAVKTMEGAK